MVSSSSSVTFARNEGFDVSGELVEFARFFGGFDLAMDAMFEEFQVGWCRAIFAHGVIRGFHRDGPKGDDFSIHDNPDIVTLEGATQQIG